METTYQHFRVERRKIFPLKILGIILLELVFILGFSAFGKADDYGSNRLAWFTVTVYNGDLYPEFSVYPGFRDNLRNKLVSAIVQKPNGTDVPFVLTTDRRIWNNECRYIDWWEHNLGTASSGDNGDYTLTLTFADGATETHTQHWTYAAVTCCCFPKRYR